MLRSCVILIKEHLLERGRIVMDLLKTILVYMALVFTTSVQTAPEPSYIPENIAQPVYEQAATPSPTPSPRPTPVPTINITPNPEYKTIQVGDDGPEVRQMQEKLAEYGYYTGEIDGRFGNQTRRAVEAFQYQHGLSADGIAGRRTLTVLYESPEIRMAPQAEVTPSPTPEAQLTAAVTAEPTQAPQPTVEPTPSPSFAPIETAAPLAASTQEPAPFLPMEGWSIHVSGNETPLMTEKGEAIGPFACGDEIYLPLKEILKAASLNVISSDSLEMDEFAFAMGDRIIRIAYTENQAGEPASVEAFIDSEPQIMAVRDIRRNGEVVYLPATSIQGLTGMTFELDEVSKQITVVLPEF